ncbi:MAG: choice-of-anchor Q domain-containing protein [Anaerolineaceae bacterium]|jgi:hypothetical protein
MNKKSILLTSIVLVLCALLLSPMPAKAQAPDTEVFIVDTFQDLVDDMPNGICSAGSFSGGPCSLRAAVSEAHQVMVRNQNLHIQLPYGTYVLTQNDPSLVEDAYYGDLDFKDLDGFSGNELTVTIEGMGIEPSVIDANGIDRVLEIGRDYNIILKNLVITGGKVVANVNEQGKGGGIFSMNSKSLELDKVRVTDNEIICNECTSTEGGGIFFWGKLTINDSEIDHNTARYAAAISAWSNVYPVLIRESAIHSNSLEMGRVIVGTGMLLNLVNSTVEGEVFWTYGDVWIQNSTLYTFDDTFYGRGNIRIVSPDTAVELKIKNSILITQRKENPSFTRGPNCFFSDPDTVVKTSLGGNIFSDETCPFNDSLGDIRVGSPLDARLGPLQNNGGRTPTRALLTGSPAIDKRFGYCTTLLGTPTSYDYFMLFTDQRRVLRNDLKCDSGAFEYWPPAFTFLPMTLR